MENCIGDDDSDDDDDVGVVATITFYSIKLLRYEYLIWKPIFPYIFLHSLFCSFLSKLHVQLETHNVEGERVRKKWMLSVSAMHCCTCCC